MLLFLSLALVLWAPQVLSVITDLDGLAHRSFDFVVIGGGAGGSAIANRLTEDPDVHVLLIEAGGSNEGVLDSAIPGLMSFLTPSPWDWNFTSTPQSALNNRTLAVARGFILGGSTGINQMVYTRGTSEDWDSWAAITDDEGWSWNNVQKYIRRNERFTAPADHHNTTGQFDPSVHSFDGVVSVSLQGFSNGIDNRTIQTLSELSEEFPFNLDMNSGFQLGIGWVQATIGDGTRSSAGASYLGPQFISRPNLHVLLNTRVLRMLETERLSFRSVEFTQDAGNTKHTVSASKEVILSAGSIMTPHILMHSGIGDSEVLSSFGIETIHHLPSVGKNLSEQPIVRNEWLVNSTDTFETIARNATLLADVISEWENIKMGPLVDPPLSFIGWLRLPDNASIFQQVPDPAAGPNTSHYELILINGILSPTPPATGNFLAFSTSVASPTSRGSITLNTSNPLDYPLINPNLFSTDFDRFTVREAFRATKRFLAAQSWDGYILAPPTNATTDEELDEYVRENAATENHPAGTAAMSSKNAAYGVVDPDLLVKGLRGLRIVDASIFPRLPAAHTQVPVYIVAERAADLIKSAWKIN
ncbi:aryl-alcohol-oxidase from pleurotus Eryingii [Rhodocollybia butyracea]|uniref:Aryl-alcohol-oxidase from pleurotus Eryingii n=1 Tax=Rhodocollybia butyracea TaxID=206335 RepID=A0A9P5PDN5_9AGAR|nr:aryl-alcohol-oxidase from pleurotus Eryingii [Rhodocollybia butyracea]